MPLEDQWEEAPVDAEGRVYFPEAVELAEWLFGNIDGLDGNTIARALSDDLVIEYAITRLADDKIRVTLSTGDVRDFNVIEIEKISDGEYREYSSYTGETVTYKDTIG